MGLSAHLVGRSCLSYDSTGSAQFNCAQRPSVFQLVCLLLGCCAVALGLRNIPPGKYRVSENKAGCRLSLKKDTTALVARMTSPVTASPVQSNDSSSDDTPLDRATPSPGMVPDLPLELNGSVWVTSWHHKSQHSTCSRLFRSDPSYVQAPSLHVFLLKKNLQGTGRIRLSRHAAGLFAGSELIGSILGRVNPTARVCHGDKRLGWCHPSMVIGMLTAHRESRND